MIPNGLLKQLEELETEMRERRVNHGRSESPTLVAWANRLAAIRAAVGGEAVAWMLRRKRDDFVRGCYATKPTAESLEFAELDGDYYTPLYASPPATVDVGAIRKALNDIREAVTQEPEDKFGYSQVDHGSGIPRAYSVRENILCTIDNRLAALIGEKA